MALAAAWVLVILSAGCMQGGDDVKGPMKETRRAEIEKNVPKTLTLESSAFPNGSEIPREFTCQGADVSPPLRIGGIPGDAAALALIMDDPDAPRGTFTHWTFWDLPPNVTDLPRDVDVESLGASEGMGDFGSPGYGGPCPPSGSHRYFLRVYALREPLGLEKGASVDDLRRAMEGKMLAWGELMGTYRKS